jgi:hypothetical protein
MPKFYSEFEYTLLAQPTIHIEDMSTKPFIMLTWKSKVQQNKQKWNLAPSVPKHKILPKCQNFIQNLSILS